MEVYKDRVEVDERLKGFQYPTGFEIYENTDALKGWVVDFRHFYNRELVF